MLDTNMNINVNMASIKVLSVPLVTILVTIILFVTAINVFGPKIPAKLTEIRGTQATIQNLNNRINVLRTFDADVSRDRSDVTYLVLPDINPAGVALAQVKRLLVANGLTAFSDVEFSGGAPSTGGIESVEIKFSFSSDTIQKVASFLRALEKTAPLITVTDIDLSNDSEGIGVSVLALIYWSELPKTLPDLTMPVSGLTTEERATLDKVLGFGLPDFAQNIPNAPATERVNPFN